MANFTVFYEFPITKITIDGIVEDFGLKSSIAEELFEYMSRQENIYTRFEIPEKPGLLVKLVKNYISERLPHPIEGLMASVHADSDGILAMNWFRNYMRASLEKREITYIPYDTI